MLSGHFFAGFLRELCVLSGSSFFAGIVRDLAA
jgi:hypothetical protein